MKGTAWVVSNNYYTAATGKIVTRWPHCALLYGFLTNVSGRLSSTARRIRGDVNPVPAEPGSSEPVASP
jgi:hypothetical protein